MSRIIVLIDGFNLYHALDFSPVHKRPDNPLRYRKYKWLNLAKLAECYAIEPGDTIEGVYYFTALAYWNPSKVSRHQTYIAALENEGVQVIYGEFKDKKKRCTLCHKLFPTHEEKQTDVNIAVTLFQFAVENQYDKVIIISGDTDQLPAVRLVQSKFPEKKVGVVIPIGKASEDFKKTADFHYKMREKHLQASLLDDPYTLPSGNQLVCPPSWK
ncbi:MAG TPA: NYN domain-containing protein [Pyrinomonadaceae bacterium]|jgi:uncharacterized LabA/DUF88 family protein